MTGPQLPSPEHATTLDADLRELKGSMADLLEDMQAALEQRIPLVEFAMKAGEHRAYMRAAESRLRSRITALELENERFTTCGCGLQLSTPRCRICDNDE